ncbi:MAG: hypothetical protein ABEI86_11695 [Halobacteriaceae archaeon]
MYDEFPDEYQKITEELSEHAPSEVLMVINAEDSNSESAEIVASPIVPARSPHQFNITLVLARNLYPRHSSISDGQTYKQYRADNGSIAWVDGWHSAVGTFMTMLEAHGISEKQSRDQLSDVSGIEKTWESIENQTEEERTEELKSYLESYSGDDSRFDRAREFGSKREIGELTDEQMELVEDLLAHSNKNPGACYESSITAVRKDLGNERISYVEGVSIPKYGGFPQAHAWFEIDGKVVEPTWPWHRPIPPEPSVYYGESFDPKTASDVMANHGRYGSVVLIQQDEI